ncbi:iron-containing alcohol dehydrogenase family protein [Alteribacter natronophilus]|uniref:iron-containing alcohol dehydrogenase family protein n=1 Tax=Alteribacter natronophilus TaxID=2583810 RepID=UPI00110F4B44|nr:iron-containing alcohol dehydrogenase family protein [Alteribacter natronophilus]TMW71262.1 iron-containing alcohol dehydrogenase family protein [Alteribacter natronophilus]
MTALTVQPGPGTYVCEPGSFSRIEQYLKTYGYSRVLFVHGERSFRAAETYLQSFENTEVTYFRYDGLCSDAETKRAAAAADQAGAEAVIGLGGGSVLDLAKAAASRLQKDAVLLPTLASTCAAWTGLSVIYDDEHRFIRFDVYDRPTRLVLVEPDVIARAPVQYLRAGIADTLAKWYEAKALAAGIDEPPIPVTLALSTARICRDTLLHHAEDAVRAAEKGELTSPLQKVIEANILAGGLVGSLGDRYGRVAAAHSVHNALTQFEETRSYLHGEKVAYGILLQLELEGDTEAIAELLPFYRALGLPSSLAALGLKNRAEVKEALASRVLIPGESIHQMQQRFTETDIIRAVEDLEAETASDSSVHAG